MNYAIILSGGTGTRLGADIPKQYLQVGRRTILNYAFEAFATHSLIQRIVIVAASEWIPSIKEEIGTGSACNIIFAAPGQTRQFSILNALEAIAASGQSPNKVIIHDAARPLISKDLISSCLNECSGEYSGTMPVIPVKDTIYASADGTDIDSLLERSTLFAGQAPEAFLFEPYYRAHKEMPHEQLLKINGSSELAYLAGMKVKLIKGDPMNFKITDAADLHRFKSLCHEG